MVMTPVTQLRGDELRANLLDLAEDCPMDHCNPDDCPLFAVRLLNRAERRRWIETLEEDDLAYLATYHHVCLSTKLKLRLAGSEG